MSSGALLVVAAVVVLAVGYHLGYEVLAADRRVVARVQLGPGIDGNVIYPPLDRGSYVAMQVANVNSGPAWTEVER